MKLTSDLEEKNVPWCPTRFQTGKVLERVKRAVVPEPRPFLNMRSSAVWCPRVLALHHQVRSNTQEHKNRERMKVPGCDLDIKDASNTALHANTLEIPEVTAAHTSKFVLPRLPRKTGLYENTSLFLEMRNGQSVPPKRFSRSKIPASSYGAKTIKTGISGKSFRNYEIAPAVQSPYCETPYLTIS